ncbi:MAG: ATPase domain-containing protein [Candidatus Paceibacterota bacterium]|jgi:recombination protein RecA
MAKEKTNAKHQQETKSAKPSEQDNIIDDFSADLIKQINKEHNEKLAFNLGFDDAPTVIKNWISTGSRQLDYIISNVRNGGLPEGRVVEIQGPPSCGKSHIGFEIAKSTQQHGGIVVYIDTENATNLDNLKQLGIDVYKRFVFVQSACTEEIFQVMESAIIKAKAMSTSVPVTLIWDSVAASSPKAELEGDYDQNTIGLQARVLGKGLRKITNLIGNKNVLLVLMNQQRMKIGVMYGDPTTTPGGMAIPYASSVRIRISAGKQIEVNGQVVGIQVTAKTIKNKVARPFREAAFEIHFGRGVKEPEQLFDLLRTYCSTAKEGVKALGKILKVEGTSAWKTFTVTDEKTGEVDHEIKFYKNEFAEKVLNVPQFKSYIDEMMDAALIMKPEDTDHFTFTGVETGLPQPRSDKADKLNAED